MIAALISQPSVKAASVACGLGERQIYERLKDPEFCRLYKDARRDLLSGCLVGLQSQLGGAVSTMTEVMQDKKASSQVRLNAAESIIRNALKISEQMDIFDRLDDLERQLEEAIKED